MKLFEDEINNFVRKTWIKNKGDDNKWEEMMDYYENLLFDMKHIHRNTVFALIHCKSFEEIADEFTTRERRKKPLTVSAIRKRAEKALNNIKKAMIQKYGQ